MKPAAFVTLFKEVGNLLADPARQTVNPGAGKHEYTGALKCDVCSGPIKVSTKTTVPKYTCRDQGCVVINKEGVDRVVQGVVLGYLVREDVYAMVAPADGGAELEAVRSPLAAKRAELAELETAPRPQGARAKVAMLDMIDELEGEITELEERETRLTPGPSPLAELFDHGPDIEPRWKATPVEVKRQIAALLLSTDGPLGQVRVMRVADSESDAVTDRLRWVTTD